MHTVCVVWPIVLRLTRLVRVALYFQALGSAFAFLSISFHLNSLSLNLMHWLSRQAPRTQRHLHMQTEHRSSEQIRRIAVEIHRLSEEQKRKQLDDGGSFL